MRNKAQVDEAKEARALEICKFIGERYGSFYQKGPYTLVIESGGDSYRYSSPKELLTEWSDTLLHDHAHGEELPEEYTAFLFDYIGAKQIGVRMVKGESRITWAAQVKPDVVLFGRIAPVFIGSYPTMADAICAKQMFERTALRPGMNEKEIRNAAAMYEAAIKESMVDKPCKTVKDLIQKLSQYPEETEVITINLGRLCSGLTNGNQHQSFFLNFAERAANIAATLTR